MLTAAAADELSKELQELLELQKSLSDFLAPNLAGTAMLPLGASLEKRLRDLIEKARSIAERFGPEDFSVAVGLPFGAQISFTWKI